jgi:hypothetical protein
VRVFCALPPKGESAVSHRFIQLLLWRWLRYYTCVGFIPAYGPTNFEKIKLFYVTKIYIILLITVALGHLYADKNMCCRQSRAVASHSIYTDFLYEKHRNVVGISDSRPLQALICYWTSVWQIYS